MFFKKERKKVTSRHIFNIKQQMAGIYIHIPFCKQRCSYCAFYSTTLYNIRERYVNALCEELAMRKDYTILVPNMLPRHFKFIISVLETYGYKLELLETNDEFASLNELLVYDTTEDYRRSEAPCRTA